jgi:urea transport system substrate-binding protein
MTTDVIDIALVVPSSGPSGIYGPSCQANAEFAAIELNRAGGILDREVRLFPVDGGRNPDDVAAEIDALVSLGVVDAVVGWHPSSVRTAVTSRLQARVPYIYTAVYEGGEHTPGVFLTGETPSEQILPAMQWMAEQMGITSWMLVGSDYVWPRRSARAARAFADQLGVAIRDEIYVPVGTGDFSGVLRRVEKAQAEGVLVFLLGSDAVRFNRAFARRRLHERFIRLSPLMDEGMLLATGASNTYDLYSTAGFFETLGTVSGLDFEGRYFDAMGATAPGLASPGESCYEGITLLAQLASKARSSAVSRIIAVADTVSYEGPRGAVRVRDQHLLQRIYLARADGLEFDVLTEIRASRC